MNLLPAIDLMNGRVVRLKKGRFDAVTFYDEDPLGLARAYERSGARCLHVVDLDGARGAESRQREIVRQMMEETRLELQIGGGIRTVDDARGWLDAGAARVVVGSIAVTQPDVTRKIIDAFGAHRITLAVDVFIGDDGRKEVAVRGWTEGGGVLMEELLERWMPSGIAHVLCTDISRDGMLRGPNFDLYASLSARFPGLSIQASGGVETLDDLRRLRQIGVAGAIVGRALLERRFSLEEALAC